MSVIIAALRSAVVPRGGAFESLKIHQLAEPVIRALLSQGGIAASDVDQLILANSLGAGGNPARVTALAAGMPSVSGISIDTQCAGGLDAVALAAALVDSGAAGVVIAGGAESYSRRPIRGETFADGRPARLYTRPPFSPDPATDPDMTDAADSLAEKYSLSREAQDAWAIESHRKAMAARDRLQQEIVPIAGIINDRYPRHLSERLAARSATLSGSVSLVSTAVEADGAAFCLVVSEAVAARLNPAYLLTIRGTVSAGADSRLPGYAPVVALRQLFAKFPPLNPQECITEMMEAYASQAMVCVQESRLSAALTNRGGGALARGHPIGASGAILICRLFHELQCSARSHGVCAIAAAGGLGSAMLLSKTDTRMATSLPSSQANNHSRRKEISLPGRGHSALCQDLVTKPGMPDGG